MNKFSQNLKAFRIKRNMSVRAFSQALSIPYTTYSNYEAGGEPKIDTLIKIADYLNISIDELLGYTPNEYEKTKEFLADYEISVTPATKNPKDTRIRLTVPVNTKTGNDYLARSMGFFNNSDLINFVNSACKNCIDNNIVDCITDKIIAYHIKEYQRLSKSTKSDNSIYFEVEPPNLLEAIRNKNHANKKNPPPSEVGEGLKG